MSFHYPLGSGGGGSVSSITGVDSISASPTTGAVLVQLVNDAAVPGNSKYYGTDSSGTRGFFSLSLGTILGTATANQVSYGTGANTIGSNSNFTYNTGTKIFNVGFSGGTTSISLNEGTQTVTVQTDNVFNIKNSGLQTIFTVIPGNSIIEMGDVDSSFSGGLLTLDALANTAISNGYTWNFGSSLIRGVLNPSIGTDAANKQYVDSIANGLSWKTAVMAGTVSALPTVVYNNGASGVGATLTAAVPGVLTIDGYTPLINDRLLIQNQVAALQNGIYTLTTVGTGGVAFILTRATDNNTSAEMTSATVLVTNGSTNAGKAFTQTSIAPTMGTTAINWVNFLSAAYTAGSGLSLTGNVFSINFASSNVWTATQQFNSGDFKLQGSVSGLLTINTASTTTAYTITHPGAQGAANTVEVNDGAGNLSWKSPSFGLIEEINLEDSTASIVAQTYTLTCFAVYGYTIETLHIISGSGTCTAAVKINGTNVTGLSAVSVSTTISNTNGTAAKTVNAGDIVTLVITSPSSLSNLQASIKTIRT